MVNNYIESNFHYKGYECMVVMTPMWHRCGYVKLPSGHKYEDVLYDDITIDCHGGLTWSASYVPDQERSNNWWIGFDCGHAFDAKDYDTALAYFANDFDTVEQLNYVRNIEQECGIGVHFPTIIRTQEFCEEECRKIVDQLISGDKI